MKKLLLVLLVVTLASFLFVGCTPTVPAEGEGEGEGEVGICPTVSVTSQVAVGTKTYIKGGSQTITVTFAVPTEPVSVYVGWDLKDYFGVLDPGWEVVMYPDADKKVYTGDFTFGGDDCAEAYIYVTTCETCAPCKYPYTVDTTHPYALIAVTADECTCEGVALTFKSTSSTVCSTATACCDDDCSGLATWAIDMYSKNPFDVCCDTPCVTPVYSCSGVGCPVDCVTDCLPGFGEDYNKTDGYWIVTTLLDEVGNQARYYTTLTLDLALKTALAGSTSPVKVPVVEYSQDKVATGGTGDGVCSWFCREINGSYDTGEYGFCSDSPDNVVASQADCVEPN